MSSWARRAIQCVLIVLMAWGVGVPFPQTALDVRVEVFYDGVWNNITTDVFDRDGDHSIVITRGRNDEGVRCDPGVARLKLNNVNGKYSPRNPTSPLYGKIGRNTQLRISVVHNAVTYTRFVGEITAWPPKWDLSGKDVWVDLQAWGIMRRLGQGASPVQSALRRTILGKNITGGTLLAYWTAEDGSTADHSASALPGGPPLNVPGGLTLADDDTLAGSLPLPTRAVGTPEITGRVHLAPATGTSWTYDLWIRGPVVNAGQTELFTAAGEIWEIFQNSIGEVDIFHTTAGGTVTFVMGTTAANGVTSDTWHSIRLVATQNGANTDLQLIINGVSKATGTKTATSIGVPTRVQINDPAALGADTGWLHYGHVNVWDGIPSVNFYQAGLGWSGERADVRIQRLCDEESVSVVITGSSSAKMGPQRIAAFLDNLENAANTDRGFLFEQRAVAGLAYRTNMSRYGQ